MRPARLVSSLLLVIVATPAGAVAGTPEPTDSLGRAGGLEYLRTNHPNVVTQAGPMTACDPGEKVTGGGAAIQGKPAKANLNSSGPTNAVDAWIAEGRVAQGSRTVTGWAICTDQTVTIQSSTDSTTPVGYITGFTCNTGQALSGGVVGEGGANVVIRGMFPAPDPFDWSDSMQTIDGGSAQATSSMLCSSAFSPQYRSSVKRVRPGEAPKVVAKCAKGEVAAGGGLSVTRNNLQQSDVWAASSRPWDSRRDAKKTPEDGWLAKAFNDTEKRVDVTSYATCVPK